MKKFTFIILLLIISTIGFSQDQSNEPIVKLDDSGNIQSVKFHKDTDPSKLPSTAEDFFKKYLKISKGEDLSLKSSKEKIKGSKHESYQQYYKGIKVDNAGYTLHFQDDRLEYVTGHRVKVDNINTSPSITSLSARNCYADFVGIPLDSISDYTAELLIKEIPSSGNDLTAPPKLVYKIILYIKKGLVDEIGYIDAHNCEIIATVSSLHATSATGDFETRYNGSQQAITDYSDGTYRLLDETRGATIHTWDLEGSTDIENDAIEVTDNDNDWTAAEHAAPEHDMALDIHWALQEIYDHIYDTHQIDSWDGDGFPINAYIHYSTDIDDRDNAYWDDVEEVLLFGDGYYYFRPVASLDVIGHEYGHATTEFHVDWSDLNSTQVAFFEALGDIWGAILEYRINNNSMWEIGEQLTINYDCMRNMQDNDDPNALQPTSDYYLSEQYNNGGSYNQGGVFAHWFYLIVTGDDESIDGLGMDKAEDLIAYSLFNGYIEHTQTYPGLRADILEVAECFWGENSCEVRSVTNAWNVVGVGSAFNDNLSLTGPDLVCSNATYTINNPLTLDNSYSHITWSVSPSLVSPASGSGYSAYLTKTGNGNPTITFEHGCVHNFAKDFHTGPYSSSDYEVSGPESAYCESDAYYTIPELTGVTSINWIWPSEWTYVRGQGTRYLDLITGEYSGVVGARVNNTCGQGGSYDMHYTYVYGYCGGYYMASPNPASNYIDIDINPEAVKMSATSTYDEQEKLIRVYDEMGTIYYSARFKELPYRLKTNKLPEGNYVIQIIEGQNTNSIQIIINR